jgi:hypothetical protein
MPYHRFKLYQMVVPSSPRPLAERFTIVRLLPPVGDEPRYRLANAADGKQQDVFQAEIRALSTLVAATKRGQ